MAEASIYFHGECSCGINTGAKITGNAEKISRDQRQEYEIICAACGTKNVAKRVTAWEYERHNAIEDECTNCGQPICFLPDLLTWVHERDDGERTDPDYGLQTCEAAMAKLFGLPIEALSAQYAGLTATPADTHVTVDLKTGESETASETASKMAAITRNVKASTQVTDSAAKEMLRLLDQLNKSTTTRKK